MIPIVMMSLQHLHSSLTHVGGCKPHCWLHYKGDLTHLYLYSVVVLWVLYYLIQPGDVGCIVIINTVISIRTNSIDAGLSNP